MVASFCIHDFTVGGSYFAYAIYFVVLWMRCTSFCHVFVVFVGRPARLVFGLSDGALFAGFLVRMIVWILLARPNRMIRFSGFSPSLGNISFEYPLLVFAFQSRICGCQRIVTDAYLFAKYLSCSFVFNVIEGAW